MEKLRKELAQTKKDLTLYKQRDRLFRNRLKNATKELAQKEKEIAQIKKDLELYKQRDRLFRNRLKGATKELSKLTTKKLNSSCPYHKTDKK